MRIVVGPILPLVVIALGATALPGCARLMEPRAAAAADSPAVDVDAAAQLVVDATNTFRREQQRRPVGVEAMLTRAGQEFAAYMARTGRFGHTADGRDPAARAEAHGYAYCIVAENIAEY